MDVGSNHSFSQSSFPRNPFCTSVSTVFAPRASQHHFDHRNLCCHANRRGLPSHNFRSAGSVSALRLPLATLHLSLFLQSVFPFRRRVLASSFALSVQCNPVWSLDLP
jgi:hypothetical protein